MELARARVIVVGATGALGSLLAEKLAAGGARLVVTGRDPDKLAAVAERVGAEGAIAFDLVDVEAVSAAVDRAADTLGGLDGVLVASGVAAFGPARDDDDAIVEELFAVNTLGPMAVVRSAVPHLAPAGADRRPHRDPRGHPDRRDGGLLGQQGRLVGLSDRAAAGAPQRADQCAGRPAATSRDRAWPIAPWPATRPGCLPATTSRS